MNRRSSQSHQAARLQPGSRSFALVALLLAFALVFTMTAFPHASYADTHKPLKTSQVKDTTEKLGVSLQQMLAFEMAKPHNAKFKSEDMLRAMDPAYCNALQFANLKVKSGLTAAQIDRYIDTFGSQGALHGTGEFFLEAENTYGISAAYFVAHAVLETGWGTSALAKGYVYNGKEKIDGQKYPKGTYYNFFGIGAIDGSPVKSGREAAIKNGWNSKRQTILDSARWIADGYVYGTVNGYQQSTLYAMRWDYQRFNAEGASWHQYATGTDWAVNIASCMNTCYAVNSMNPMKNVRMIKPEFAPGYEIALAYTKLTYNGKQRTPKVTVKFDGTKLKANTDYTVTYPKKRTKPGTYKVKVKFIGQYADQGTKTLSFKIVKKKKK